MPRTTGQNPYLDLPPDPLAMMRSWPEDRPIVMLHSGESGMGGRGRVRWSILASPEHWLIVNEGEGDPLALIEREMERSVDRKGAVASRGTDSPFTGGWIGFLSYDLGCAIEPAAQAAHRPRDDRGWPLAALARCRAALVFDHVQRRWSAAGEPDVAQQLQSQLVASHPAGDADWSTGDLRSSATPDAYLAAVTRTLDYIAAGDIFQANITQRLTAEFEGSARAMARQALALSGSPYGAYLEVPGDRFIVSMSPELFLEVRPLAASRDRSSIRSLTSSDVRAKPQAATVTTRPIKGTRPIYSEPGELRDSIKDAAELHMIVDLMRNDLGRVCEYGSVHVTVPRAIETFPGAKVHHGVAEITGTLREHTTITDLLRATFPAGSITGAPKIRAMQIIDELEPVRRGPYCGAIGFISDDGHAALNVAIRTIAISNGVLDYGAGGGIVADSDPAAEYRESHDKAAVLRGVLAANRAQQLPAQIV